MSKKNPLPFSWTPAQKKNYRKLQAKRKREEAKQQAQEAKLVKYLRDEMGYQGQQLTRYQAPAGQTCFGVYLNGIQLQLVEFHNEPGVWRVRLKLMDWAKKGISATGFKIAERAKPTRKTLTVTQLMKMD